MMKEIFCFLIYSFILIDMIFNPTIELYENFSKKSQRQCF
jgi:hypothetical protein